MQAAEQNNINQAVATHTRPIGIIHPPPDIRGYIEKTAKHVSISGILLEKKIKAKNANDPRFNFLNSSDPFHAFYQHKLNQYQEDGAHATDPKPDEAKPDPQTQFKVKHVETPEPEKYTARIPEGITDEELHVIKLTAQFAARNGRSFLNGLIMHSRENNDFRLHFMKPTHSMFPFFSALVNAYTDVLMPPKDLKEKLRKSVADFTTVLERCLNRFEWDRLRKKEEDEKEVERVQMATIDWHVFEVVTSIDFYDEEDEMLGMPKTLEEIIRLRKVSKRDLTPVVEAGKEVGMEMDEEEAKLVDEGMIPANLEGYGGYMEMENVNGEEIPMRVVKNWKRPEDRFSTGRDLAQVVESPITGELIPISEMSEHMRISLIDPKFKEQKDRMFAKIRETTLAQDDEIAKNIVGFARLRPDIFGTTEEEVSNAVKAEMEKKTDEQKQVIWDGHTRSIANQALTENFNGEEKFHGVYGPSFPTVRPFPPPRNLALNLPRPPPSVQYLSELRPLGVPMMQPLHQQHQFYMPGPPVYTPMMMNQPPHMQSSLPVSPPQGSQFAHLPRPYVPSMGIMQPSPMPVISPPPLPEEARPPLPEEAEPKRQKLDESALVPEDQFLAQHQGSATIRVSVPNVKGGKVIEIAVQSLSENVRSLKEKIAGETHFPANKQKLSGKAGFLKDNMSLAHYNVAGEVLTLSLRERGGRK